MDKIRISIFQGSPDKLAKIIGAGKDSARIWRQEELAAVLKHQMAAPIYFDLANLESSLAAKIKVLAESGEALHSFSDLLQHPCPPMELLLLVKDFCKANQSHPDSPLPPEITILLYYATIACAFLRCGKRISELNDQELHHGFSWGMGQYWVEPWVKDLLSQAISRLHMSKA